MNDFGIPFKHLATDERIKMPHLCLYAVLYQLWERGNFINPIVVKRKEIMLLSNLPNMRINKSYILPSIGLLIIIGLLIHEPIAQDPSYHNFADNQTMFGIPNFLNVITNLPFAVVAFLGLSITRNTIKKD